MIEHLIWTDDGEVKLRLHGISRAEVVDMVTTLNYIIFDSPYSGQVRATGYTTARRWLTLAMEEYGGGTFRPITGWAATDAERERFVNAERGLE